MADKEFLSQIRDVMVSVLRQEVPPMVRSIIQAEVPKIIDDRIDTKVPGMIRAVVREELHSLMEHQIMPQFEDMHAELGMLHREVTRMKYQLA